MRICCVISSLSAGGAERVMSLLASDWARRGHSVSVITLAPATQDAYVLDPRVRRIALNLIVESRSAVQGTINNLRRILGLRRTVASLAPRVVVSFMDQVNVLTLVACAGLRIPVVVSERIHPASHALGRGWSLLRRLAYRWADALVVQSAATRAWAESHVRARCIRVIPNPVGSQFLARAEGAEPVRQPMVLGVGRLVPQKGFDLLLKAFQAVSERHPEWSLVIAGQGPLETELKRLAAEFLTSGRVVFPGLVRDPERYYRAAGLFVLPSRYEGFPNVLLEAMASGCAVIATECPGGTSEIIRRGVDGVYVPCDDIAALAREMDRLMSDSADRSRLGARAAEVSSRFGLGRVAALWEKVISDVRLGRRGASTEAGG